MADRRKDKRHIQRYPVEVKAGDLLFKGTTVRLSERGMFVRSQKNFIEGIPVDITIYLTEESSCCLKGIVKYARTMDLLRQKNGMGIEIIEKDQKFLEFIKSVEKDNR
jgi:hypothetical protein